MNTRALYKRLRRAATIETMFGDRLCIDIRLPTSLLSEPPPPDPELPSDLAQDLFVGYFIPKAEVDGDDMYTRTVVVQEVLSGAKPEGAQAERVVPGTLQEIAPIGDQPNFRWYETYESRADESGKYKTSPYPVLPWVLQEIARQEWHNKAYNDAAHPILARLATIHFHASKKGVHVFEDGLHVSYSFKLYDRDRTHLMNIARTTSRAVRFAKRQSVPIRIRVY